MADMVKEILNTVRRLDNRVEDMDRKIVNLEDGMNFASSEIAELKAENAELKAQNAAMASRMDNMETKMHELEIGLVHESEMRDAAEANSRLIYLEISGIPKLEGETRQDCKNNVGKVMALMGSENGVEAVDVAHRKFAGGYIVKFKSRCQRDEVYSKRFNLTGKTSLDLGFINPTDGNPIYVNESLSFDRSKLMKEIRDRLKILNVGKNKDNRIKAKTENGVIKVHNRAGDYVKVTSMRQFNTMYKF